ncbi:MAG: TRAP transporter TatT component family protein [Myxococcota bacterium]|nr:TRAP transporter TatT component family protein [Myxococcota bacterium]MDW8360776.1 TRAP transporter TatT component family protein [Myxococcales bacterium]
MKNHASQRTYSARWPRATAFALALVPVACGGGRQAAWESTPTRPSRPPTEQEQNARQTLLAEAEAAWNDRLQEPRIREAIDKWRRATEMDPSDWETLARLSRAYYFLADGHLSFDESKVEETKQTFELGIQAAERSLVALSPDFAERMRAGARIEEAISVLDARAIPALYWRSTNMGKWALLEGFATVLAHKDEVRAIMARILEMDANFFYAAAHRYFGALYARLPAFAGGDLERSRQHFEASLRAFPNYFPTRVLYAEYYAVKSQNRALFTEQLQYVINGDVNAMPEVVPENTVEQRRARALLARADELFE